MEGNHLISNAEAQRLDKLLAIQSCASSLVYLINYRNAPSYLYTKQKKSEFGYWRSGNRKITGLINKVFCPKIQTKIAGMFIGYKKQGSVTTLSAFNYFALLEKKVLQVWDIMQYGYKVRMDPLSQILCIIVSEKTNFYKLSENIRFLEEGSTIIIAIKNTAEIYYYAEGVVSTEKVLQHRHIRKNKLAYIGRVPMFSELIHSISSDRRDISIPNSHCKKTVLELLELERSMHATKDYLVLLNMLKESYFALSQIMHPIAMRYVDNILHESLESKRGKDYLVFLTELWSRYSAVAHAFFNKSLVTYNRSITDVIKEKLAVDIPIQAATFPYGMTAIAELLGYYLLNPSSKRKTVGVTGQQYYETLLLLKSSMSESCIFQEDSLLALASLYARSSQRVDVIITELHPCNPLSRNQIPQDVVSATVKLLEAVDYKGLPLVLIIDTSMNVFTDSVFLNTLKLLLPYVKSQQLSLHFVQSAGKFLQLGADVVAGGVYFGFSDFPPPQSQTPMMKQLSNYLTWIIDTYSDNLAIYVDIIRKNNQYLYNRLSRASKDSILQVVENIDADSAYICILVPEVDIKDLVCIQSLISDICQLDKRNSFGFPKANITIVENVLRISIGIEDEETVNEIVTNLILFGKLFYHLLKLDVFNQSPKRRKKKYQLFRDAFQLQKKPIKIIQGFGEKKKHISVELSQWLDDGYDGEYSITKFLAKIAVKDNQYIFRHGSIPTGEAQIELNTKYNALLGLYIAFDLLDNACVCIGDISYPHMTFAHHWTTEHHLTGFSHILSSNITQITPIPLKLKFNTQDLTLLIGDKTYKSENLYCQLFLSGKRWVQVSRLSAKALSQLKSKCISRRVSVEQLPNGIGLRSGKRRQDLYMFHYHQLQHKHIVDIASLASISHFEGVRYTNEPIESFLKLCAQSYQWQPNDIDMLVANKKILDKTAVNILCSWFLCCYIDLNIGFFHSQYHLVVEKLIKDNSEKDKLVSQESSLSLLAVAIKHLREGGYPKVYYRNIVNWLLSVLNNISWFYEDNDRERVLITKLAEELENTELKAGVIDYYKKQTEKARNLLSKSKATWVVSQLFRLCIGESLIPDKVVAMITSMLCFFPTLVAEWSEKRPKLYHYRVDAYYIEMQGIDPDEIYIAKKYTPKVYDFFNKSGHLWLIQDSDYWSDFFPSR